MQSEATGDTSKPRTGGQSGSVHGQTRELEQRVRGVGQGGGRGNAESETRCRGLYPRDRSAGRVAGARAGAHRHGSRGAGQLLPPGICTCRGGLQKCSLTAPGLKSRGHMGEPAGEPSTSARGPQAAGRPAPLWDSVRAPPSPGTQNCPGPKPGAQECSLGPGPRPPHEVKEKQRPAKQGTGMAHFVSP